MTYVKDIKFNDIRGNIAYDVLLGANSWFRVGGKADLFFRPADTDDLSCFLKQYPKDLPILVLGAASNILIRDNGFRGAVIKLGRGFGQTDSLENHKVFIGAAVPDMKAASFLAENSLAGGEFLRGIPGTIGGALCMNAGAYGREVKDIFISANALNFAGDRLELSPKDMGFSYRSSQPRQIIYTGTTFQLRQGLPSEILQKMQDITQKREETQPVKSRTGGSTFKNPEGHKAWELIDKAGCRGLSVGAAQMSELHCNFMINHGGATAYDLETLGETVRKHVYDDCGILLQWEIKYVGAYLPDQTPIEGR